jgi:glutamate dehydrogenase
MQTLTKNPNISRTIIDLFFSLFDPQNEESTDILAAGCSVEIDHALENVLSLDEDRVLRSIVGLVEATLRTNFFQLNSQGHAKSYLSLKLDSNAIEELPQPRPYREIFVYSPRVEGVHLRGDRIARGGIRWSDRLEDYRTEILGLKKAQQVKNSLIVPMGAKGGFVVKQPPTEGGKQAFLNEGIECYKIFIRGLLDITDNQKGSRILPPKDVLRRDDDDPYLVVAADKGTATFSDIANSLSEEYGFWLGDAFASGGSAGYDHKKMGITARGAWESVKRHFRELGHDTQSKEFRVVGVGDMSGDVFGNGMLLSKHICLFAAFNHMHIFCDPNPDPVASYKERQRLFNNVKGWGEYNTKLLSQGGRIYNRTDKSVKLTAEIKKALDVDKDILTPNELIKAILKARTDLLWFGGIGTYIKASQQTHMEVGDKANDPVRIDASELRCNVIGEGANLAITQKGRVEFAERGGKINADFIDNSGGVDSSDHEVNIKILLSSIMEKKDNTLTLKKRNKLLSQMTDEVATLVLKHNYHQSQAISLMSLNSSSSLALHEKFIKDLEKNEGLKRDLEGLPDEEEVEKRLREGRGLNRPELSTIQAYAKILFTRDLLRTDIPDQMEMEERLINYFPIPLRKRFKSEILGHRLKREIIATTLATGVVNRMGPTFVKAVMNKVGVGSSDVARAYIIVRDAFSLRPLWDQIESLDNKVLAEVQLKALKDISTMAERETIWFLTRLGRSPEISTDIKQFKSGINELRKTILSIAPKRMETNIRQRIEKGMNDGLPKDLAESIALIPSLGAACDIVCIARDLRMSIKIVAEVYFQIGEFFHMDWLRRQAKFMSADDKWSLEALEGIVDQLDACQAGLTKRMLGEFTRQIKRMAKSKEKDQRHFVKGWIEQCAPHASQIETLFEEIRQAGTIDLSMLIIAEQRLRNLYGG